MVMRVCRGDPGTGERQDPTTDRTLYQPKPPVSVVWVGSRRAELGASKGSKYKHMDVSPEFSVFSLGLPLQRAIAAMGFVAPRPIQTQTIPALLAGRDVLGLAETGTGKTAAFALPILERLRETPGRGIRALVVAPTRELATQIDVEIRALAKFTNLRTVTIYGGVSTRAQVAALRHRPDIVVACPGRLLDLLGQRALSLDRVEILVLDEADHLFDMGFLPDVKRILYALPRERQNLLFSATMPSEVRGFADRLLRNPHVVELSRTAPASTIRHELYPVHQDNKFALLRHLLDKESIRAAIVFTRTKHRAERLAMQLARGGRRAVALQGNMSQSQRDTAMEGFRRGKFDLLVATDLASRGLDVLHVSHVINFDVPNTPVAYTHRLGRTGRAERSGVAYTFVTDEDREVVREIEHRIGSKIPRQLVEGLWREPRPAFAGHGAPAGPGFRRHGRGRRHR
jgi:ATP-dependent RNA helicase RhlE